MFHHSPDIQTVLEIKTRLADVATLIGKRFVTYYPVFTEITGSPKAALMLGHAIYMSQLVIDKMSGRAGGEMGWFYKTAREWNDVTGLSGREVASARETLLSLGIMDEKLKGMPAKLWYRVDFEILAHLLCEHTNQKHRKWSWQDRVLKAILGRPVLFHVAFAKMANSAIAGLYMSSLFGNFRQCMKDTQIDDDGYFCSSVADTLSRLHLGRFAISNARERLIDAEIITEKRERKAQSRMLTRIDLQKIMDKIGLESSVYHCLQDPANKNAGIEQTRVLENAKLTVLEIAKQECGKSQNKSVGNRKTSYAITNTLSYKEINTTYQPLHNPESEMLNQPCSKTVASRVEVVDEIIFPKTLLPFELIEIKRLLNQPKYIQCRKQLIIDEWASHLNNGRIHSNRLGYLRALLEKEIKDELIIELGYRIQEKRKQDAEITLQRKREHQERKARPVQQSREENVKRISMLKQIIGKSA